MFLCLLMFPLCYCSSNTWVLPARSTKDMDVTLPVRNPSKLAPLTITTKVNNTDKGKPGHIHNGKIFFSSSFNGHFNSWSVNLTGGSEQQISKKTLCFEQRRIETNIPKNISLVAFSNTDKEKSLEVEASWDLKFVLRENKPMNITLTPFSPKVFQYSPDGTEEASDMFLIVKTLNNSNKCMYVAINEPGCPWNDQLSTVRNSKLWARILETGYFNIRASEFPNSFTITLVPLQNSSECLSKGTPYVMEDDKKTVTIVLEKSFAFYKKPMIASAIAVLALSGIFFLGWYLSWRIQLKNNRRRIVQQSTYIKTFSQESVRQNFQRNTTVKCSISPVNAMRHTLCSELENKGSPCMNSVHRLMTDKLTLPDMCLVQEENERHKERRSKSYLYLVPLLSLFYIVPSAQMIFAEAQREKDTGSEEGCFSNYGCSRSWWIFDDFNHIISNCGYVIFGIVFIFLVRKKAMILCVEKNKNHQIFGSNQQYSIFYTLGICLILQGVCSGIFHLCPSNTSLQFDTTIMYIMLILAYIKIYQFRHPDLVFDAFHVMYAFAVLIVMEACSIYIFTRTAKLVFNVLFVLLYVGAFLHIALYCYYYGAVNRANLPVILKHSFRNKDTFLYPRRLACCIFCGLLNFGITAFIVSRSFGEGAASLSTPILVILALNAGLFLTYYMVNKVNEICQNWEGEAGRRLWAMRFFSFTFFLLALVSGLVAMHFYVKRHASRNVTPQESRNLNEVCEWLDFFDNHDMWHFVSATALFTAFIFLLTIDDDLLDTPWDNILVF